VTFPRTTAQHAAHGRRWFPCLLPVRAHLYGSHSPFPLSRAHSRNTPPHALYQISCPIPHHTQRILDHLFCLRLCCIIHTFTAHPLLASAPLHYTHALYTGKKKTHTRCAHMPILRVDIGFAHAPPLTPQQPVLPSPLPTPAKTHQHILEVTFAFTTHTPACPRALGFENFTSFDIHVERFPRPLSHTLDWVSLLRLPSDSLSTRFWDIFYTHALPQILSTFTLLLRRSLPHTLRFNGTLTRIIGTGFVRISIKTPRCARCGFRHVGGLHARLDLRAKHF